MRIVSYVNAKTLELKKINSILCGLMVVFAFVGRQISLAGLPLYLYFLVCNVILLVVNNNMKISLSGKLHTGKLPQLFALIMIVMAVVLLPLSVSAVGFSAFINCITTAVVILVVYANCKTAEEMEALFKYIFIGHLVVCCATQYELVTGNHFIEIVSDYYDRIGQGNAFGFQGNINDNATVLVLCLFSAIYFWKKRPVFVTAVVIWTIYLVFCIGSRMSILAILSIVFVAVLVLLFGKIAEQRKHISKVVFPAAVVIVAIIMVFILDDTAFLDIVSNEGNYSADADRIGFLRDAFVSTAGHSLFLGNGAGMTQHLIGGRSIHSALVEVLCDYGIFTLIPLLILLVKLGMSFIERVPVWEKMFFTSFTVVFIIMSFCSSSMLHILEPWMLLVLVWKYYQTVQARQ